MYRTSLAFLILAALVAVPATAMASEGGDKVTLCHVGGNGQARTIEVSERAAYGWAEQEDGDDGEAPSAERASDKGRAWKKSLDKSHHPRVKAKKSRVAGHLASHKRDYLGPCEVEEAPTTTTTMPATTTTTEGPTTTTTQPTANLAPVADFNVRFVSSGVGYVTRMDGSPSFDPEGNALTYSWTHSIAGVFGNVVETSTEMAWDTTGLYQSGQFITITLQVSDGTYVGTTSRTVEVP